MSGPQTDHALTTAPPSPAIRRWLPHLALLVWLVIVSVCVWQAALRSAMPPVWDQQTYVTKAKAIWDGVHSGQPFNPLNVEPVVRPPGTVLVTYPLGFDPDPRPFYFRTVILPVVLFAIALYVALTLDFGWLRPESWIVPALTAFALAMPMFWQFEVNGDVPTGLWGLVDPFFAAVAALAAAAFFRSARQRSLAWFLPGILAAALCPLIKPTGMLVSGLLGLGWAILAITQAWRERGEKGWLIRWLGFFGGCGLLSLILLATWVACLRSEYFSPGNIAFGQTALAQIAENLPPRSVAAGLWWLAHIGLGWPMTIFLAVTLAWAIAGWLQRRGRERLASVLVATMMIIVGAVFWHRAAQMQEVRYYVAFLAPGLVWFAPVAGDALRALARPLRLPVIILLLLPAANVLALLLWPSPPPAWQNLCGINVTSGQLRDEIATVRRLPLADPAGDVPRLYALDSDVRTAGLEAAYGAGVRDRGAPVPGSILRPLSWEGPSVVRLADLWRSRYILCSGLSGPPADAGGRAETFLHEVARIRTWLHRDPAPEGTRVVIDVPSVRLLEVVDPAAFRRAAKAFVASHQWRERFTEANRPQWIPREALPSGGGILSPAPVKAGADFLIHRVDVGTSGNGGVIVSAAIEPVGLPDLHPWTLFVHGLGERNERLWARGAPLWDGVGNDGDGEIRVCRVEIPLAEWQKIRAIGMGIHSAATGALELDSPQTFRNGHAFRLPTNTITLAPLR